MATYELYVGGPGGGNNGTRSQFPSAPFNPDSDAFINSAVAAHKGPVGFNLTRVLDFGSTGAFSSSNSFGLADFVRKNPLVQGDKLGIIFVPPAHLLLGVAWEVESPMAAGSVDLSIRGDATNTFAAIDTSVVGNGFLVPGAAASVSNGAVDLSKAVYKNVPYIFDLELTDITPGPLTGLRIKISPLIMKLHSGEM